MNYLQKHLFSGNKISFLITPNDTLILKGFAICAMLWHHLFAFPQYMGMTSTLSFFGKICVSIFLFVSAYGLTIQYGKIRRGNLLEDTIKFEIKRYFKFYFNYWFVFMICVPIGVFVFHIGLSERYNNGIELNGVGKILYLATDILGVNNIHSYNITWWFNKLIIVLYFFFPLLYWMIKKIKGAIVLISIWIISSLKISFIPALNIQNVYFLVFVFGIWAALNGEKLQSFLSKFNSIFLGVIILLSTLVLVLLRLKMRQYYYPCIVVDAFLTIDIVLSCTFIRQLKIISAIFKMLGKHSMNIYMVHSFMFYYFFKDFIYSFQYSIAIFAVLLFCSLVLSMIFELIKQKSGYYKLMNMAINKSSGLTFTKR